MNNKTITSLLMVFLITILSGCANKEIIQTNTIADIYEPVSLTMYLVGDKPKDADVVYQELNKLIKEELNASLSVNFISWSDYEHKYPLVLASGVGIDLIYTGDWCFYDSESRKGAFKEITEEDIKKYMPLTYKSQSNESFEQAKIDGKVYMIPNNQLEYASYKLVAIRGDLREKYGLEELKTIDDLKQYYKIVKENENDIIPYATSIDNAELAAIYFWQKNNFIQVNSGLMVSPFAIKYLNNNTDYELINIFKTPEYIEFAESMQEWNQKGFWSESAISNRQSVQTVFENGESGSLIWNLGTLSFAYTNIMKENPHWKPEIYDITPNSVRTIAKFTNDGVAVANSSKNYERSLMLLDKLKNDERYWNLTWLGIEGKHWEHVEGNIFRALPDSKNYSYAATSCWGWGNVPFQKLSEDSPSVRQELQAKWKDQVVYPITELFRFNADPVKEELSRCKDVLTQYQPAIELGIRHVDVELLIEEMNTELEKAGLDKVETEFRKQFETFMDTQAD